ncbi:MAG: hypothetical protein Q7J82_09435 [Coriobacteriia bacterium]|nr:hypothetical protein [Coriobacteriia bacterium]
MLWMFLGLSGFFVLAVVGAFVDPIGWGYLLSSRVDEVAEARLAEPVLGIPVLYFVGAFVAAAGVAASSEYGVFARFGLGLGVATFLLVTVWDLRRRRGSLAVYIRLRRVEIGFEPKGDVIEVPKLMFGVMNQPGPVVWLMLAGITALIAVDLWPHGAYYAAVPLLGLAVLAIIVWRVQTRGPWEPLARVLRQASFVAARRLEEHLESALDVDPEVMMLRHAADSVMVRLMRDVGE